MNLLWTRVLVAASFVACLAGCGRDADDVEELLKQGRPLPFVELEEMDRMWLDVSSNANSLNPRPLTVDEVTARDVDRCTLLHSAATLGDDVTLKHLIANGAEVEARSETSCPTPLALAAYYGRWNCVEVLLKAGARIDRYPKRGTELMSTCRMPTARMPPTPPRSTRTLPWELWPKRSQYSNATEEDYLRTAKLLLAAGADPRLRDGIGSNALYHAKLGESRAMQELIEEAIAARDKADAQRRNQ